MSSFATLPSANNQGLAFDGSGNLYVAGTGGTISKITFSGAGTFGSIATAGTVTNARGITYDGSDIYVVSQSGSIDKFTSGGAQSTIASGSPLNTPFFITYGSITGGVSAPEPGTLPFLALGGTLVLARRRRK